MKPIYVLSLVVFLLFAFTGLEKDETPVAPSSYFLQLEDINGEATDQNHKDWINLLSFNQAISKQNPSQTGAARRRANVVLGDIVCVKELDKSSTKIQESLAKGKVIPKAFLELKSGRNAVYLRYELTNVMVSSYNINASGDVPMEEFALNFEQIKVVYTQFDHNGRKKGESDFIWNVSRGQR